MKRLLILFLITFFSSSLIRISAQCKLKKNKIGSCSGSDRYCLHIEGQRSVPSPIPPSEQCSSYGINCPEYNFTFPCNGGPLKIDFCYDGFVVAGVNCDIYVKVFKDAESEPTAVKYDNRWIPITDVQGWSGTIEIPRVPGKYYLKFGACGGISTFSTHTITVSLDGQPAKVCNGSFDGANYFVMSKPNGGFIYNNSFYVHSGASSCPAGTTYFNSEKCFLINKPNGGVFYNGTSQSYFRVNGNFNHLGFVYYPQYGKSFYYLPAGSVGQEQTYNGKKKWFIQKFQSTSCPPNSTFDGANCYICSPPCGKIAFEFNGNWYYKK